MEEILKKKSFWNVDCFTENSLRNIRRGLKKLLKQKRRNNIFFRTEFVYSKHSNRQMKDSFWNPDRKVLSRKSEFFLQIVAKKSKERKVVL